jgi:hypothetical protein
LLIALAANFLWTWQVLVNGEGTTEKRVYQAFWTMHIISNEIEWNRRKIYWEVPRRNS